MTDDTQVVIRDGQRLGNGSLYADFGDKEVIVVLDPGAMDHPRLVDLPDNETGQSVRSPREAIHRAGLAATHARARGGVDADGRIVVEAQDLDATE